MKGFKDGLKTKGEDIAAGKIAYPMARAFSILLREIAVNCTPLWGVQNRGYKVIARAIELMDSCQAIDLAEKGQDKFRSCLARLDPLVEDSMVKINLRAFSWYVLDRTY